MQTQHKRVIVLTALALAWGSGGVCHAEGFALFFGGQKWLDDQDWPVGRTDCFIGNASNHPSLDTACTPSCHHDNRAFGRRRFEL